MGLGTLENHGVVQKIIAQLSSVPESYASSSAAAIVHNPSALVPIKELNAVSG